MYACECMIVGTIAFDGIVMLYRCKHMALRKIRFLIDLCIRSFKLRFILGSFSVCDQNEPKIKRSFKLWMHRPIRNSITHVLTSISWYDAVKCDCTYYGAFTYGCECMIVGTIAFDGIVILYQCKHMEIRRIKFLIDLCIWILKFVLFWGRFGQTGQF